jgi:hypothetical protein
MGAVAAGASAAATVAIGDNASMASKVSAISVERGGSNGLNLMALYESRITFAA